MASGPVGVGIIGAGVISKTYAENLNSFPDVNLVAIGDLYADLAEKKAEDNEKKAEKAEKKAEDKDQ